VPSQPLLQNPIVRLKRSKSSVGFCIHDPRRDIEVMVRPDTPSQPPHASHRGCRRPGQRPPRRQNRTQCQGRRRVPPLHLWKYRKPFGRSGQVDLKSRKLAEGDRQDPPRLVTFVRVGVIGDAKALRSGQVYILRKALDRSRIPRMGSNFADLPPADDRHQLNDGNQGNCRRSKSTAHVFFGFRRLHRVDHQIFIAPWWHVLKNERFSQKAPD